jgi:hypothetical protein
VIRAFVLYDAEPDSARYEEHVELCRQVPGARFRHGRVFGAPSGEPRYRYYAEFEFPDMDAFRAVSRTPEFAATGEDATAMGVPLTVLFAEVSE